MSEAPRNPVGGKTLREILREGRPADDLGRAWNDDKIMGGKKDKKFDKTPDNTSKIGPPLPPLFPGDQPQPKNRGLKIDRTPIEKRLIQQKIVKPKLIDPLTPRPPRKP